MELGRNCGAEVVVQRRSELSEGRDLRGCGGTCLGEGNSLAGRGL